MAALLKRTAKAGLRAAGVDLQQVFARVRLDRSRRRFLRLGERPMVGYDVNRHFGDQALDESHRYVMEGFITARLRFIREGLSPDEMVRGRFADIGDSNGVFLKALGKTGLSINPSDPVLRNIQGMETLAAGLPAIPLPDGSFDYVLCFETLEHLHDPIAGLKELARLARRGVFVSIPFVRRTTIYPYWTDRTRPAAEHHVFECSHADFQRLLTYAGLRVGRWSVHQVFDPPRTPVELLTDAWWRMVYPDLLCAVFRRFSLYYLTRQGNGQRR